MDFTGAINSFWGQLGEWASVLMAVCFSALPNSPFIMLQTNTTITNVLPYINYVIPIDFMISTLELWLVAVGIYYVWQVLLRWLKAID